MNQSPVVASVIIPSYNRERLLEETLLSVLPVLPSNWEVIVVDDGSTDGTTSLLRQLQDGFPQLRFFEQENSGPGAARNRGIREANSDWIVFLDSDDLWLPWTGEVLAELLGSQGVNEEVVAIFLKMDEFTSKQEVEGWARTPMEVVYHDSLYDVRLAPALSRFGSCNFVARRSILIDLNGFRADLLCGEDIDLFLRGGNMGKICSVIFPTLLAYRSDNHDSLTRRQNEIKRSIDDLVDGYKVGAFPGPDEKRDRVIHRIILMSIRRYFADGFPFYAYSLYFRSVAVLLGFRDFHNIIRLPLTPFLHIFKPRVYAFRARPKK